MQTLEPLNAFEKVWDFMSLNVMKCDSGSSFARYCTKTYSYIRLGIYLSSFSELTIKFTNSINTFFLIGEVIYAPSTNLHMFDPLSL